MLLGKAQPVVFICVSQIIHFYTASQRCRQDNFSKSRNIASVSLELTMVKSTGQSAAVQLGSRHRVRAAQPSSVREINRVIVLNLIRLHQPISRNDLAKQARIHCSNVSEIVDELLREGLLCEERAMPRGRGRVPYLISLNGTAILALSIDIRYSTTYIALGGLGGDLQHTTSIPTPHQPTAFVSALLRALERDVMIQPHLGRGIRQIGVSVPGWVRPTTGEVLWVPSIPSYSGYPLQAELERRLSAQVVLENNTRLGALAELWMEEKADGNPIRNFAFVLVGDMGVSAGVVQQGKLYHASGDGVSGEFGHMVIDSEGPRCRCSRRGCWQTFIADRATWHRYQPHRRFNSSSFAELLSAVRRHDASALRALSETARYLALGLVNIALTLDPGTVILAGEVTQAWPLIEPHWQRELALVKVPLQVRRARLPLDELLLRGGILLAFRHFFQPPSLGW